MTGIKVFLDHFRDGILVLDKSLSIIYNNDLSRIVKPGLIQQPVTNLTQFIQLISKDLNPVEFLKLKYFINQHLSNGHQTSQHTIQTQSNQYIELDFLTLNNQLILRLQEVSHRKKLTEERKKLIEKLQASENHLKEVISTRDKLISILSHDLKAPLHSLMGFLDLVEMGQINQQEIRDISAKIKKHIKTNLNLMEDLLLWTRQKMHTSPDFDIINLSYIVNDTFQIFQLAAQKKQIELVNKCDDLINVKVDRNMVRFIFRNLIGNALKFTPVGKKIKILSEVQPQKVLVSVIDQGIGMTREQQEKLFYSITSSQPGTENEKGTGIGLYIVKEYLEKIGGNIEVDSELYKGTTMRFSLPLASSH